jgi:V/A-type H+-transporting ATPase subunit F
MLEEIAKYEDMRIPAVVPIPGIDGSYGIGMANLKKAVERAVGADILFGNE